MGHVVFAAPALERFHLHERLHRELRFRGHRVTWLCTDTASARFLDAQGIASVRLQPGRPMPHRAPLQELARWEVAAPDVGSRAARRIRQRLERLLPVGLRFFETWAPDLLLLHGERTADRRLLQFVAAECGTRVLWTGDGLLPHTLQVDEAGIDGDSSIRGRGEEHYRSAPEDATLLTAALGSLLGHCGPSPLSRRPIQVPGLLGRVRDALVCAIRRCPPGAGIALEGWRRALGPAQPEPAPSRPDLPRHPYLCLLLQRDDDPRLRLDACEAPGAVALVQAVRSASAHLGTLPLVAVLPPGGLLPRELAALGAIPGLQLELPRSAPEAVAAAMAVITVNHPMGAGALLAGTPLIHLGRALYELHGVAVRARLDSLAEDLDRALSLEDAGLRCRFLSWLLAHGHVWCSADHPDHNGISGLVQEIEDRLQDRVPAGLHLRYRVGPAWPLTPEGAAG